MAVKIATLDEQDNGVAGMCTCGYSTRGWPNAKIASERIKQHFVEHESGELMEPLETFRARHGLVQSAENGNLAVFPEDAKEVKPPKVKKAEPEEPAEEAEE